MFKDWLKGVFVEVTKGDKIIRGYCLYCTTYQDSRNDPPVPQEPFLECDVDRYLERKREYNGIIYSHELRLKYLNEKNEVSVENIEINPKDLKISIPSNTEQMLLKLELDI